MTTDLRTARWMLGLVALGLFVSGVTIFPAIPELRWVAGAVEGLPSLHAWLLTCLGALEDTRARYPFLLYAGDWLAFAHIMLAVLFLGAMRDPLRNIWVVQFGLICCAGILPLALVCGPLRGIPWYWTLVDCAFAPAAALPLWIAHRALHA
jgi:hypothetical protein